MPEDWKSTIELCRPATCVVYEWVCILKSRQQIRIESDGRVQKPTNVMEAGARDAWADWNKSRDNKL
jgi:hypothetical protein